MKDPLNRTKVVIRHLPPSISESALMEQIDGRFSGRYNWFSFRPGKISQRTQRYSRAYVDFQSPDVVLEFAEYFDGHIFVNEKGSQFKALVEYAPSQRVPKIASKKDGREGTIFKDPEYVQFSEFIAKPVENLPSAEIQLERREAERAGEPKEAVIITPLMDFIRQKWAAKNESQRSSTKGKLTRRGIGAPSSSSSSSKRSSEKRRGLTSVYVLRDSVKNSSNGKDKPTYMLASRKEDQQLVSAGRAELLEDGTATGSDGTVPLESGSVEIGKRRVVLLKGKEREVLGGLSRQHNATVSVRNSTSLTYDEILRQEVSGKIIRSILSNKDARQCESSLVGIQPEQQKQEVNFERDKRPPRPPNPRLIPKDHITNIATHSSAPRNDAKKPQDDKAAMLHGSASISDKNEKHMKNRERPDRVVWTPRRFDGHVGKSGCSHAQKLSNALEGVSQPTVGLKDRGNAIDFQSSNGGCDSILRAAHDAPLSHEETNSDLPNSDKNAESRSGRANISPADNGAHRHIGRRGLARGAKEVDGSSNFSEGKPSKRGVSAGHGSHERQVWVQKPGSGS